MADNSFYRPQRDEVPELSTQELKERARLCAQITKDLATINSVDWSEVETLQRRVAAILGDLRAIKDADVVKELNAEQ